MLLHPVKSQPFAPHDVDPLGRVCIVEFLRVRRRRRGAFVDQAHATRERNTAVRDRKISSPRFASPYRETHRIQLLECDEKRCDEKDTVLRADDVPSHRAFERAFARLRVGVLLRELRVRKVLTVVVVGCGVRVAGVIARERIR